MKSYRVDDLAHTWFTDYLFQRSQVVKLGLELSDPLEPHKNLTRTHLKKLKSIEAGASSILKSKTYGLKQEIDKPAILLLRKCLDRNVCSNFQDYFTINDNNMRTRNRNILLHIPKVKLEFAKNGFFFISIKLYNLLPKDIRESTSDFENKVDLFLN